MDEVSAARGACFPGLLNGLVKCLDEKGMELQKCRPHIETFHVCVLEKLKLSKDPKIQEVIKDDKSKREEVLLEAEESLKEILDESPCSSSIPFLFCESHEFWKDGKLFPICRKSTMDMAACWLNSDQEDKELAPQRIKDFKRCANDLSPEKFRNGWMECFQNTLERK